MKFLIAGDWHSELHETPLFDTLNELGHKTFSFKWSSYFSPEEKRLSLIELFIKGQRKYMFGPIVQKLNDDLIQKVYKLQPDVLFIYRGSHIFQSTLKKIRSRNLNLLIVGYNNDDPFSPLYPKWMWRHFNACIPLYDLVLAYRHENIREFYKFGAKKVRLMRSWFSPKINFPIDLSSFDRSKYGCDVVFVGHYEKDGRQEYLKEVVKRGWSLKLFGPGYEWDNVISDCKYLSDQVPVRLVWGSEYNKAIAGSKVALCFLSKLNRDTYTRRCFEIPASKRVLLSEYSTDLATMFSPDKEVCLFTDLNDMGEKIDCLLKEPKKMDLIAEAGYKKVWKDRHDIKSRTQDLLFWISELKEY